MNRLVFRLFVVVGCAVGAGAFFLAADLGSRNPNPFFGFVAAAVVAGAIIALGAGLSWAIRGFQ